MSNDFKSLDKGMRVILALVGHEFNGLAPGELAKAAGITAADATRYRQALAGLGLVEEVPGIPGRYRLGPRWIQIAITYQQQLERVKHRLSETEQRYSRSAK